jgi:hypothetical protein
MQGSETVVLGGLQLLPESVALVSQAAMEFLSEGCAGGMKGPTNLLRAIGFESGSTRDYHQFVGPHPHKAPAQRAILDRFRDVPHLDLYCPRQIRDSAGELQDPVIRSRRQPQLLDRAPQQLLHRSLHPAVLRICPACIAPFAYSFPRSLQNRSRWIARAWITHPRITAEG